jgi:hypothetical protein
MTNIISFDVPTSWFPGVEDRMKDMELYKLQTYETNEICQTPGCFKQQTKSGDELVMCKCGLYGVCEDCKNKGDLKEDGCYCGGSVDKTCEPMQVVVTRDDLVTLLQNQGVFPPPEPQPETVYVCASGLGEPSEDRLKINIPLEYVSDEFEKGEDLICLELDKETMMKQLCLSDLQQVISAVSVKSLGDKRALVEWFLEFNKLESVEEAVRFVAVSEIASRPELVRQVFDQVLQSTVLENSELEQFAKQCLGKCYGIDPEIIHLDNGPQEQEQDRVDQVVLSEPVVVEEVICDEPIDRLIKEFSELSLVKDRIVFDAPPKGEYTLISPKTVDWLFPQELARVLRNANLIPYLPEKCLYQYVEKSDAFQVWTEGVGKARTFNTDYRPLWNARDQILDLVRFSYKKGLIAPTKNPRCPLGLTPEGRLKCLPHLFVASTRPGGKMLFDVLFEKVSYLSKQCQSGDNRPLEVIYGDFAQCGLKGSRFLTEFLENDYVTGTEFMMLTTPGSTKKKRREAKEPIQKKLKPGNNWLTME